MADYVPLFDSGDSLTATASATIVGGQLLMVTGAGTVGPATAASTSIVGVAAFDCASGAKVTYYRRSLIHRLTASGAITAGDQVIAGAAGTVSTLAAAATATATDVNNARAVIGVAMTTAIDTASVTIDMS